MTPTEQITYDLVRPIADELGIDVYDVEFTGGVLRVLLDKPGGIDVGSLADATRRLSRQLDEADPVSGSYTLEVSSPGIERNLRTPEHFAGAIGQRVKVKTKPNSGLDRRFGGILESFDDPVALVVADDGARVHVAMDQIERVRTEFVDTAAPKPGKAKGAAKGTQAKPESNDRNRTRS